MAKNSKLVINIKWVHYPATYGMVASAKTFLGILKIHKDVNGLYTIVLDNPLFKYQPVIDDHLNVNLSKVCEIASEYLHDKIKDYITVV